MTAASRRHLMPAAEYGCTLKRNSTRFCCRETSQRRPVPASGLDGWLPKDCRYPVDGVEFSSGNRHHKVIGGVVGQGQTAAVGSDRLTRGRHSGAESPYTLNLNSTKFVTDTHVPCRRPRRASRHVDVGAHPHGMPPAAALSRVRSRAPPTSMMDDRSRDLSLAWEAGAGTAQMPRGSEVGVWRAWPAC